MIASLALFGVTYLRVLSILIRRQLRPNATKFLAFGNGIKKSIISLKVAKRRISSVCATMIYETQLTNDKKVQSFSFLDYYISKSELLSAGLQPNSVLNLS
jgi:hypothetical protein